MSDFVLVVAIAVALVWGYQWRTRARQAMRLVLYDGEALLISPVTIQQGGYGHNRWYGADFEGVRGSGDTLLAALSDCAAKCHAYRAAKALRA